MYRFRCDLVETPGLSDLELLVGYFSAQIDDSGVVTLSMTAATMDQAEAIADRSAGVLVVSMVDGEVCIEMLRANLTGIRIDEGTSNKSITLYATGEA